MEKPVIDIYQSLQKLIGLHRQLLDLVRSEREALVDANIKAVQDATVAKQGLIEAIAQCETERQRHVLSLAVLWKKPVRDLTLNSVILMVQARDLKLADQMRTSWSTLSMLISRVSEQNKDNQALVEKSLEHIHTMKRNVIGEAVPKSDVYTQAGQKATGQGSSRFLSKEA